ncbi:phage portal protein [Govanella unica]|uniref:Phage portal protein n=1 Tax=Govanella unica TaxID=2975056 RepID=A0A9X3Z6D3_9PROT|nr:phage portal protein [Govania unica]MDA5192814.1 phage portal protein [Govania unica]
MTATDQDEPQRGPLVFSFGDPEPVLDRRMLLDQLQCMTNGRWYEPPLSLDGLARAFHASPHHASAIQLKRNLLVGAFVPSAILDRATFKAMVQDYLVFGNCYAERRNNMLGEPLSLQHAMAKYVRRGVKEGSWFFLQGPTDPIEFRRGSICHLRQPELNQEIYGLPEYLSALNASLLNESATLFRRKYYQNGSHAGFILYATGDFAEGDVDAIRVALKKSKGPGNFRNLFIHAPNGKVDGIKLLPVAEVAAKDEFLGIKNTTRDDVLAAHRVPPQLLGIVPTNAGGFGKVTEAVDAFYELEIQPLMREFEAMNDWLGEAAVTWKPREKSAAAA